MHNAIAQHPPTDTQTAPEQRSLLPGQHPHSLYTEHDVIRCGIALWSVWINYSGCAPSQCTWQSMGS